MIQVGQLSVYLRKDVHQVLVNCLGLSLLTDRLDLTIVVDWDVRQHSNKQKKKKLELFFPKLSKEIYFLESFDHVLIIWNLLTNQHAINS